MTDSILTSIKELLGIPAIDTAFDPDLITTINSALMNVNQLGVGPTTVFSIADATETWTDFLGAEEAQYSAVKSYIHLLVKEIFDPPSNAAVLGSMQKLREQLEWRLTVQVPTV